MFTIGLDLGFPSDFTALCVLETPTLAVLRWERSRHYSQDYTDSGLAIGGYSVESAPVFQLPDGTETSEHPWPLSHNVRHLDRWRGAPYPEIVDKVRGILGRLPDGSSLIVDVTAVGPFVLDLFRDLSPTAVSIHNGDAVQEDGANVRIPKRDLASAVNVLLQTDRLRIAPAMPHARLLADELRTFKPKVTTADGSADWRDAANDDLVLALALAAWHAEKRAYVPSPMIVGESEMEWGSGATF